MRHLTLGYLTLSAPPAETVSAAVAAGFRSVGIRITGRRVSDPSPGVVGNPAAIRDIVRRAADGGVRIANVTGFHVFPDVTWEHLRATVEAVAELGSKAIVVLSYQPDEPRFVDLFSRYCEAAAPHGIGLVLEFSRYSAIRSIDHAARVLAACGQPNAGLLVDALHLHRSGGGVADVARLKPGSVSLFQLCDASGEKPDATDEELIAEARFARLPPGDGELPLHALLDALPDDLEIEYEVPRPELQALPLDEQARIAAERFRRFMADHEARRAAEAR